MAKYGSGIFLKMLRALLGHCAGRSREGRGELLPREELVSSLSLPLSIKSSGLWVIKCSLQIYWVGQPGSWKVRAKETRRKAMNTAKGTLGKCVGCFYVFPD